MRVYLKFTEFLMHSLKHSSMLPNIVLDLVEQLAVSK